MTLALIAAMTRDRVIGKDNQLPWHLPADLQHFKSLTLGKPMIMGHHTFQSIGKALPGRISIVLTHDHTLTLPGCLIAHTFEHALELAGDAPEIMIIGGESLFTMALPLAARIYLTVIEASLPGDRYFPDFSEHDWQIISEEAHPSDDRNPYPYRFSTWERC